VFRLVEFLKKRKKPGIVVNPPAAPSPGSSKNRAKPGKRLLGQLSLKDMIKRQRRAAGLPVDDDDDSASEDDTPPADDDASQAEAWPPCWWTTLSTPSCWTRAVTTAASSGLRSLRSLALLLLQQCTSRWPRTLASLSLLYTRLCQTASTC
jgi:hypothetical protein